MPPEKRTRTGKARGGHREKRPTGGASIPKKQLPTSLLAVWLLAVLLLGSLLYFSKEDQRLPELPLEMGTKTDSVAVPPRAEAPAGLPQQHEGAQVAVSQPKAPPVPRAAETSVPADSHGIKEAGAGPGIESGAGSGREGFRVPRGAGSSRAGPRASIVIDDFGPDVVIARQFASLPFPVTLSVLPHQAHSREIAELAHEAGREVILHLPMEPLDRRENPGPGALLVSMSADQLRLNIRAALETSPYFDGVNNHMGSRMTRNEQTMKAVLSELKGRDLFFIDSMTTSESKGWKTAKELKIPTLKRDIFLDDDPSADAVRSQIARLMKVAKVRGTVLAIGHPRETTLRSLQEAAPHFREEGIEMVAARDLIDR